MRDYAAMYANLDEQIDAWKKLVQIKDGMIWQLLDDRKKLEKEVDDLTGRFRSEMDLVDDKYEKLRARAEAAGINTDEI